MPSFWTSFPFGSPQSIGSSSLCHTVGSHQLSILYIVLGFPSRTSGKETACQCRRCKRCGFDPWVGRIPGEGNGKSLLYSCLENSLDRGAWWATVYRVTKSRTQLSNRARTHIHSINNMCTSIPTSQFILPSLTPFDIHSLFSTSASISALKISLSILVFFFKFHIYAYIFFYFTYHLAF